MTKAAPARRGSRIKIGTNLYELVDRAPKGWWALELTSRKYANLTLRNGKWEKR